MYPNWAKLLEDERKAKLKFKRGDKVGVLVSDANGDQRYTMGTVYDIGAFGDIGITFPEHRSSALYCLPYDCVPHWEDIPIEKRISS